MMDETDELLRDNLMILAQMRANGQINDAQYYKGVVCIAYEYAMNNATADAAALLAGIPEVYFKLVQPTQLVEDVAYREVARDLATILVAKGYAGLESDEARPTQAPAKA